MQLIIQFLPFFLTLLVLGLGLWGLQHYFNHRAATEPGQQFKYQITMMLLVLLAIIIAVTALPVSDTLRGQLLSLMGLVISAAIALSSTTFLGNIMAGIMLRSVRGFKAGDFLSVNDFFGRISEIGLLHIEIQTEERDLVTFPNLHLVTHPYKVVRSSGAIISATISLGYDVPRARIEERLLAAAEAVPLIDPFVQVMSLGDFSVTYRVSGLLEEVKKLISKRASLRKHMLDYLHDAHIEIVSPTFMNTRAFDAKQTFIPAKTRRKKEEDVSAPEDVMFDKADVAESKEALKSRLDEVKQALAELEEQRKIEEKSDDISEQSLVDLDQSIDQYQTRIERLLKRIERIDLTQE